MELIKNSSTQIGEIIGVIAAKNGRFERLLSAENKSRNAGLRSEVRVGQLGI